MNHDKTLLSRGLQASRQPAEGSQPSAIGDKTISELFAHWFANKTDDLRMVHAMAGNTPSEVVDFGGGCGRVALELGQVGHRVAVIDRDLALLKIGRRCAEATGLYHSIEWLVGDITRPIPSGLRNRFDYALCLYNTANELTLELDGLFRNAAWALRENGKFLLRVLSPNLKRHYRPLEPHTTFTTKDGKKWTVCSRSINFGQNLSRQLLSVIFIQDPHTGGIKAHSRSIERRIWSNEELISTALSHRFSLHSIEENYFVLYKQSVNASNGHQGRTSSAERITLPS